MPSAKAVAACMVFEAHPRFLCLDFLSQDPLRLGQPPVPTGKGWRLPSRPCHPAAHHLGLLNHCASFTLTSRLP